MFITLPGFEFCIPAQLKPAPEARHWRALSLDDFAAWHVVTVKMGRGKEARKTSLIFSWDLDLTEAIEKLDATGEVVGLLTMVNDSDQQWRAIPIREIWHGHDGEGAPCVALIDADGRTRSGFFGEINEDVKRVALVARVCLPPQCRSGTVRNQES